MNENIKKLGEQVLKEVAPPEIEFKFQMSPAVQRFAELIVKECIGIVEKQKAKMSYGPTFVIEDIKNHFGVEE